jgi:phenylacetate-CoA ligase
MLESGAFALGCTVIPGGVGQTELQATAIADLRPDGYVGTPSFLRLLLEKGAELGLDLSSLARALVSGEAFPPALQKDIAGHGIAAFQAYASADLGVIAYESEAREGLVLDEGILVEILRPGTGDPVPDGEVGEVAVTSFSPDYPLIRFATGDLSAILPGASPCGRTNRRLRGWLGRADQTTKVRGMFVHPAQIAEVARRHPDLGRVRLTVTSENINDVMSLAAETADTTDTALAARVVETLTAVTKLRGKVDLVAPGSLPNDGKVIDDRRPPG